MPSTDHSPRSSGFSLRLLAQLERRLCRAAEIRCCVWLALVLAAPVSGRARERQSLDADWAFHLGDIAGAQESGFDARSWRRVDLPHDWSIELPVNPSAPSAGNGGFFQTGVAWYRRTFDAPPSWKGQQIALEFEGVYMNAEVWINGHPLGQHPYGYTPFRHEVTPYLNFGAKNILSARVDNSRQPNTRWYSGSGIYRHVWLHVAAPVQVAPWGVFVATLDASPPAATIRVQTTVHNDSDKLQSFTVETTVRDAENRPVASGRTEGTAATGADFAAVAQLAIPRPRLWSPDTPVLYRAVARIRIDGRDVDEAETPFGVRTVRVSADRGFELNGRPLKLAGGSVHHDNGPLGAAAFDRAEERRVELLKAAGFNAVRTAHNPPSAAFLDACDRLGLLVIDEAFDGWEKSKTAHDYGEVFKDWSQRDLEAMVGRDRNHPSVVLWSIGNEVYERGNASGARIAKALTDRIRELDPTRPITAGINGMGKNGDWTKTDPVFSTLDVAGYNYEIARHADDHVRLPSRVIVATESYQSETFGNWAVAHDHPYVIGDFVWSALDYLGEAGIGRVFPPDQPVVKHWEGNQFPWHGAACGDLDLTGWRKPVSHYRNIVWDRGEKLYAAVLAPSPDGRPWNVSPWTLPPALPSWTWPGSERQPLAVEVYSRFDSVRLYLNGDLLGEKPTTRAEEFKATFTVPYVPGTLKAAGVQAGREGETFILKTAGPPAQLRLTPDRARLRADGEDLAFVTVEVLDQDGVLQPTADPAVQFAIEGAGAFAGIGNADLASLESYRANPHRVFQGRALVVVRTNRTGGKIKLTASSMGIAGAAITLESATPR